MGEAESKKKDGLTGTNILRHPTRLVTNSEDQPSEQTSGEEKKTPRNPDAPPRVLVMTVATHREPFIDLVEESVSRLNLTLLVAGLGEFFQGYGWKLQQVARVLDKHKDDYDIVLFTDSFDTYIFSQLDEIVTKFRSFRHPMVVSGEVNCWPNPELASQLPHSEGDRYLYPNSGGYIAEMGYLRYLYNDVIAIMHKSKCVDDQGELIKALALNHSVFLVDHNAVIFQTLFGDAGKDVIAKNGRIFNTATKTWPSIVHANGWDKGPLLTLLRDTGHLAPEMFDELVTQKKTLDKAKTLQSREQKINNRCSAHNPNPSLFPERNLIAEFGLTTMQRALQSRLASQGTHWHTIEQQIFEVQEYRAHCPAQQPPAMQQMCENFKVYTAPLPEGSVEPAAIYKHVRDVMMNSPYATPDPSEACVIIPAIDVSCWCETCMYPTYGTNLHRMHPNSAAIQRNLSNSNLWGTSGARHMLFEFSDAPCLPWSAGDAIIAKVGLSEFHYRRGVDVSMPLFGMVDFKPTERRAPIEDRKFLLTFRGTRSARSDAMRNELYRIDNDKDIVLLVACRFFGDPTAGRDGTQGYDSNCSSQEERFEKYTYTELILGTRFSLIVEGFGYHSFRLTEVLAAGSIPVIVVDHYVLPYETLLDWDNFAIRVPEHRFLEIPDILRSIPPARVRAMQKRAIFVYEHFFRSLALQLHTALEEVRINMLPSEQVGPAKRRLLNEGHAYELPPSMQVTPPRVLQDSKWCNTPVHRRKKARDGAIMR